MEITIYRQFLNQEIVLKEIEKFEQKCESIRKEIDEKDFHIKSQSGLVDKVMFDSDVVQEYVEVKSQELSDLKDELLKESKTNELELEKEIDERAENFIHEIAYLISVGKIEL